MKTFEIVIGEKDRAIRYTFAEARALVRRFGPLPKALAEDRLGMFSLINADPEFQVAFVAAGLAHGMKMSALDVEPHVEGWFGDLCKPDGPGIGPAVVEAFRAALYAGIIHGRSVDFDGELKKHADVVRALYPESVGGKEQPAPETPPAA